MPTNKKDKHVGVLLLAAGKGLRSGLKPNKVLFPLRGLPLINYSLQLFNGLSSISSVVIVYNQKDEKDLKKAVVGYTEKVCAMVPGGKERHISVEEGVKAYEKFSPDLLLVHDAARPFCSSALVERILQGLEKHPVVVPALPLVDSLWQLGEEKAQPEKRENFALSQTPQGFVFSGFLQAYKKFSKSDKRKSFSDDAQFLTLSQLFPLFVLGEQRNFKLTTSEDLKLAEWLQSHPDWGATDLHPTA